MSKPDEKIVFCQVDAHLDTNPKIRRAGRDGRDIFEFLLRRVAIGRTEGTVPLKYLEPWYLADQLMMSEDEARHGTSRAVTARLIEVDETAGVVRVVGWSTEWGRRPKAGAERTAAWRAKSSEPHKPVTACDTTPSHVTDRDESDALEERRREEIRGEESIAAPSAQLEVLKAKVDKAVGEVGARRARAATPSGPHQQAIAEFDAYYQRTHGGARPTWNATTGKRMKLLLDRQGLHEIIRRIANLEQSPPSFPPAPWDFGTFVLHFDKIAQPARASGQAPRGDGLQYALDVANGVIP
jgi:hypothetical protein